MSSLLLSRRDLEFVLYEWLRIERLTSRPRFAAHSRETFDAALDLYEALARERFAPHNKANDCEEPRLLDGKVVVNAQIAPALKAFCDAGLMAATQDESLGGMQLPYAVERAGMAYMFAANPGSIAYAFLSMANANLLLTHGSPAQIESYAQPILRGRFCGTMCLSEPQAGSSLADVKTRAMREDDGTYRLFGSKMWISGGDHELSENIVHLVLAKVPGQDGELGAGVEGLSLFIVPKVLLDCDDNRAEPNDVSVIGLNHKMGFRGTSNCALNFGDGRHRPRGRSGAIGFLLGAPGEGLAYMFHMMNEARIGIGIAAAAMGYTGYLHALSYARTRRQGRVAGDRSAHSPVPIVRHTDVRRMLLAQKTYVEGALALTLFSALLYDDKISAEHAGERDEAGALLDLLTPISKSWPSQWALVANDLAIQVFGGYGYARDSGVEQFYRDNRLNSIHEGTAGIQALDLLGRKVRLLSDTALVRLGQLIDDAVQQALDDAELREYGSVLGEKWERLCRLTAALSRIEAPELRMANATAYLDAFGHIVVAWIWLTQAARARDALLAVTSESEQAFYRGKLHACRYFYRWEMPRVDSWMKVLDPVDDTCLAMQDAWF
ncbi:MAG: acyl-CoA dehydrogenase [Steroidobacteraceae bacterium]